MVKQIMTKDSNEKRTMAEVNQLLFVLPISLAIVIASNTLHTSNFYASIINKTKSANEES